MCQQQAEELEKLKTSYQRTGKKDITFFIVNHMKGEAYIKELTRRVSFPVYQDDHTLQIQDKLNASTEDLFLYDRCGTLVYHLRKPESLATQGTLQINTLTTYLNNPCNCTSKVPLEVVDNRGNHTEVHASSLTSIIRRRRDVVSSRGSSLISMNRVATRYGPVPK